MGWDIVGKGDRGPGRRGEEQGNRVPEGQRRTASGMRGDNCRL